MLVDLLICRFTPLPTRPPAVDDLQESRILLVASIPGQATLTIDVPMTKSRAKEGEDGEQAIVAANCGDADAVLACLRTLGDG
jgi:hypothetical protein